MKSLAMLLFCFWFVNQSLFSQSWFPLATGNQYQFYNESNNSVTIQEYVNYLLVETIDRDTVINGNIYYRYNRENNFNWLRYSIEEKILFIRLNSSDAIYMDFNKGHGESFIHKNQYFSTVIVDTIELFSQLYICKGFTYMIGGYPFAASRKELFAKNIGSILYTFGHSAGHKIDGVVMASILDSAGIHIEFTNHYKPNILVNPILSTDSINFRLPIQVTHPLTVNPWSSSGGGEYFILSVKIESYYSKEDSIISIQPFSAFYQSFDNWVINKDLDSNLLKNGFDFNYRIIAVDKGLIPETSYSPDSGYYKCVWDFSTDVEVEDEFIVKEFSLFQNYPNPFNPSTKISWQSPVSGWQTLKVFDVLGREVATLVSEFREAGRYEITFDASNLSSGIYYYQLRAGEFVETKKMMVVK